MEDIRRTERGLSGFLVVKKRILNGGFQPKRRFGTVEHLFVVFADLWL